PSVPRNCTCDKSGSFRLASPPTSPLGWAKAAAPVSVTKVKVAANVLANRHPRDARFAIQMRMGILQGKNLLGMITCLITWYGTAPADVCCLRLLFYSIGRSALPEF